MFKVRLLLASIFASILGIGLAIHATKPHAQLMQPIAVKIMGAGGFGTAWNYRGYIVTAAHVCQSAKTMDIIINDHAEATTVLLKDELADLCVLAPTKSMPLELKRGEDDGVITQHGFAGMDLSMSSAKMRRSKVERSVIGIFGNPFTGLQATYVHVYDKLSGINKPGMSGGPAVNAKGEVVGLLTGGDGVSVVLLATIDALDIMIDSL